MWKGRWMGLPLKVHLHLQHALPQHTHARLHLHPHLHTHMHIRHTDALVRVCFSPTLFYCVFPQVPVSMKLQRHYPSLETASL